MKSAFAHHSIALSRHAGPAIIDQIMVSGVNFLMALYLARQLGISAFGQYSIVLIMTMLMIEIQRILITSPMIVFAEKYTNSGYLNGVAIIQNYASIVLTILMAAFIFVSHYLALHWKIADLWLPAAIFIFGRLKQEFLRRQLFVSSKPVHALIIDSCSCLIIFLGIMIFDLSVGGVLLIFAASYLVPFTVYQLIYPVSKNDKNLKHVVKTHWKFGKWLLVSSVTTYLSSDMLVLIGSSIIGTKAAGIVKSSQYLMGGMIILFQAMENIVPKRLSFYKNKQDYKNLKRYFCKTLGMVMTASVLHGMIIFYFIDDILKWLNSDIYTAEHYPIAVGYCLFSILLSVNYTFNYLLRVFEKTNLIFLASATTAIVSLMIGKPLIDQFGVSGIMIGFFIVQMILLIIYLYKSLPLLRGLR